MVACFNALNWSSADRRATVRFLQWHFMTAVLVLGSGGISLLAGASIHVGLSKFGTASMNAYAVSYTIVCFLTLILKVIWRVSGGNLSRVFAYLHRKHTCRLQSGQTIRYKLLRCLTYMIMLETCNNSNLLPLEHWKAEELTHFPTHKQARQKFIWLARVLIPRQNKHC